MTLEELVLKFQEHAIQADKSEKEWIAHHEANNPGVPLPEHLVDGFNLPRALGFLCEQIIALRDRPSSAP